MNDKQIVLVEAIVSIIIVGSIGLFSQVVNGFVDGNNNGRDDVQEWKT